MINAGQLIYPELNKVATTYPIVAENGTKYPFIIYKTTATRPEYSKDGIYDWIYHVQVDVVDDQYDTCVSLCSQAVDNLLALEPELDINIEEVSEDFANDAYIREIDIIIKI